MSHVLVVDDDSTQQRVLGYTLKKYGYTVSGVYDGQAALDFLQNESVDLIISDIAMPGMDGLTFIKHLDENRLHGHKPIIMLTASGQDRDRHEAQQIGVSHFLTKPTSSRELLQLVETLLTPNR